jgi:hypothetical protein
MFGFRASLPVSDDERQWVDESFERLSRLLGRNRLLTCTVIEPTDQFFPDSYDQSDPALERLFSKVCKYMQIDRGRVEFATIPDSSEVFGELPEFSFKSDGHAGVHFGEDTGNSPLIGIKRSLLKEPLTLVAAIAHELGHVVLLDDGHMSRQEEDMEPLTDLVTVYLGLGIFTANACQQFRKFRSDRYEGWSTSRLGYLNQNIFGYALAYFAEQRGEVEPKWAAHLCTNVLSYYRKSVAWLRANA